MHVSDQLALLHGHDNVFFCKQCGAVNVGGSVSYQFFLQTESWDQAWNCPVDLPHDLFPEQRYHLVVAIRQPIFLHQPT